MGVGIVACDIDVGASLFTCRIPEGRCRYATLRLRADSALTRRMPAAPIEKSRDWYVRQLQRWSIAGKPAHFVSARIMRDDVTTIPQLICLYSCPNPQDTRCRKP